MMCYANLCLGNDIDALIDHRLQQFLPCIDDRSFQFVHRGETALKVDHLLKGTPDGTINQIQFGAVGGDVWLNKLRVLGLL